MARRWHWPRDKAGWFTIGALIMLRPLYYMTQRSTQLFPSSRSRTTHMKHSIVTESLFPTIAAHVLRRIRFSEGLGFAGLGLWLQNWGVCGYVLGGLLLGGVRCRIASCRCKSLRVSVCRSSAMSWVSGYFFTRLSRGRAFASQCKSSVWEGA